MAGLIGAVSVLARFGGGMGRGGGPMWMMPIMFVLGVLFVFGVLWFIFALVRYFYRSEIVPRKYGPVTPLAMAQRRYAAGEISAEEFEKIKQALLAG